MAIGYERKRERAASTSGFKLTAMIVLAVVFAGALAFYPGAIRAFGDIASLLRL